MFLDFDNDGWPDLMLVNGHVYPEVDSQHLGSSYKEPRIVFHNNGDGTFSDISASAGAAITAPASSRGLAVVDLLNNGQIAAVINNMNAAPSLLANQLNNANYWIGFRTVGTKSNRDGIGARIRVKTPTRVLVDEVRVALAAAIVVNHHFQEIGFARQLIIAASRAENWIEGIDVLDVKTNL